MSDDAIKNDGLTVGDRVLLAESYFQHNPRTRTRRSQRFQVVGFGLTNRNLVWVIEGQKARRSFHRMYLERAP